MYGSFLSGGLAGHVYGAEGIWGADIEPAAPTKMWDAFQWNSGAQMKHLRTFAFSIGKRYQEPGARCGLRRPRTRTPILKGYEGWAYAARTPDQNIFLVVFREGMPEESGPRRASDEPLPRAMVRSALRERGWTLATET